MDSFFDSRKNPTKINTNQPKFRAKLSTSGVALNDTGGDSIAPT